MGDYPQIKRVKDPPNEKTKPLHPNLPQTPSLLLMISPLRTGKSTIISNLLLNEDFYGQDHFDQTIVISPTIHNDKTSRFLKKCADCYDEYTERNLEDRPDLAIVLDDIIGVIRREAYINGLASRFRHYNIRLLLMSSQNFRKVSPVIRSNATHVIIGSPFPNNKELGKIAEEYGDQFGGPDNFLKIYHTATPAKYDFLYLDLTENPPVARKNFGDIVAYGGQSADKMEGMVSNLNNNEEIKNNTSL
jgi:hypothetical protein